jgi:hypothetical protein
MSNIQAPGAPLADKAGTPAISKVLHRVCIQCNNVFRVPTEKFDAKQCPNCHKG